MKRWIFIAAGALVLVIIIVASVRSGGPRGEKVYLEPVRRGNIEAVVSASGEIDPRVKVNISAHVIGKIERLYFKEGDIVRRGQRLVDLERVSFSAQRDRMRSEVANRRIDVLRARTNLQNAERQYRRAQSLRQQGIQAEEVFDRAEFEYQNARTALASSEEGVRQAAAALAQAEDDLSRTTILSPMDGKVVELHAQEGEVVVTGTMNNPGSVIAVVADLSEVLVEADVGETDVVSVRIRHAARIKVDAIPDHEYAGRVVEIGNSATTRAGAGSGIRYFKVKVAIVNPDERLRPGMTSQVDIVTQSVQNVLTVPVQAVVEMTEEELKSGRKGDEKGDDETQKLQKYVFTVQKGKAVAVRVTTGISDTTRVAITSGLKEGQKVVTGPFRVLRKLSSNDPVQESTEAADDASDDEKKDGE